MAKRGPKIITFTDKEWEAIDQMCQIQCTGEEIASVMGVSYDTLERRIREKHGVKFAEYIAQKAEGGKASLRRMQWKTAQNGNVVMQIFLGKNYLKQSDKIEQKTEHTINPEDKVKSLVDGLEDIFDD